MILAAVQDTPYRIVLILHILTAMAAMAPAFAHPFLGSQSKGLDESNRRAMLGFLATNSRRIYAPALIATGVFGFGLSGMSEGIYELSQGWLLAAIIVWVVMNGILHALLIPAERAVADGDDSAQSRVDMFGAAMSILLLVMLYLMVFRPGL